MKNDKTWEALLDMDKSAVGQEMYQAMVDLFPICRSITGEGVRQTHEYIRKQVPITTHEVPTGTQVLDWTIPKEWNIKDAYVIDPNGRKIIDFRQSNLHVLNYSTPINTKMSLEELTPHLHTLPEKPDLIPYLTSYYSENWGFCLSHNQLASLEEGTYEVVIDSSLADGHMTYSEYYLKGQVEDEVLVSCYTCHPSMCDDNLSGVVLTTFLAKYLSQLQLNYSYRFLFIPETIGAITWLSLNEANLSKIKHGLVATCVGDRGHFVYKRSRRGNFEIDRAAVNVLKNSGCEFGVLDFFPIGSDERQFCSPGFDLPVGSLTRSLYGDFPEYHTSADNLEFVDPEYLGDSLVTYLSVMHVLDNNKTCLNLNPKGEPQLGKRGLYRSIASEEWNGVDETSILWVLNLSDGDHSLLDISDRSGRDFRSIKIAADALLQHGLLQDLR